MGRLFLGTSGWTYEDWEGIFYPPNLKGRERLVFYSKNFNTVEVNYSFYHLPRESIILRWKKILPSEFLMSLKLSRYVTHIKRLRNIKRELKLFIKRALLLEENLGPILIQMPPSFGFSFQNFKLLSNFLAYFRDAFDGLIALEVRNNSFSKEERFFQLLNSLNVALVISDSNRWPRIEKPEVANFVYIRYHGPSDLFSSLYPENFLNQEAAKIKRFLKKKDVFIYFNNDCCGYAIKNVLFLREIFRKELGG